tara:strand:- start:623 stop:1123 length:501 start_codon:yes stop_codon:yes gene_type:complete
LSGETIIMGIDPGLKVTGWGVIKKLRAKDIYISHGFISTKSSDSLGQRLNQIFEEINDQLRIFNPNSMAIEKIFANKNPESTLKLGKARAMIFLAAAREKLEISEYSPNTIKKNLVGYGHANKIQILQMIKRIFPNILINNEDAGDALAVAICHSMQLQSKIRHYS